VKIFCLNGGSSSLKFAAYRLDSRSARLVRIAAEDAPAAGTADSQLERVLAKLDDGEPFAAAGHRIVFGGPRFSEPTRATDAVLRELEALVAIEPLHLRAELDLVYAVERRLPSAVQVLCFDTAFHRRGPAIAKRLPLPHNIDPLIQRYGFHGLSYEYVSSQLSDDAGRTVVAHLGSGASLCALNAGVPVDTTMGFSSLGGLMMGTRPGDLDPGIVLRLLGSDGYSYDRLSDLFYHRSGLLGVSGSTADMKTLIEKSATHLRAREAVELFVYQLVKHLGAMVAVLGGLNTLVFTGGIGENAPLLRGTVCAEFGYLGVRLDEATNQQNARVISRSDSRVAVEVIPTDENLMIARHAVDAMKKISARPNKTK
jgi:acetate kinase